MNNPLGLELFDAYYATWGGAVFLIVSLKWINYIAYTLEVAIVICQRWRCKQVVLYLVFINSSKIFNCS